MQLARDVTVSEHWFKAYKRAVSNIAQIPDGQKGTAKIAIQVLVRDNNAEQALKVLRKKKVGRLP
jgi:aspartokinase